MSRDSRGGVRDSEGPTVAAWWPRSRRLGVGRGCLLATLVLASACQTEGQTADGATQGAMAHPACQTGPGEPAAAWCPATPPPPSPKLATAELAGLCDRPYRFAAQWPPTGKVARVDDHGAKADGQAYDDPAIAAAIQAAGPGGTVAFTGGKTYVLCRTLYALEDQTWTSEGDAPATLRRCAAIQASLTQPVAVGGTTVTVADASAFEPGLRVAVLPAGETWTGGTPYEHRWVKSIQGNELVLHQPLAGAYAKDSLVITSFGLVETDPHVSIVGLRIDGNREANATFVSWQAHWSVLATGDGVQVRNSHFVDSQSDAIMVLASVEPVFTENVIERCNGSAFHFSTTTRARIQDHVIRDTNLRFATVVHAEAAVTWSLHNRDVEVAGSCVERSPVAAFGQVALHGDNRGVNLHGNLVRHTHGFVGALGTDGGVLELNVRGNLVFDARVLMISGGKALARDVVIRNNELHDTGLFVNGVSGLSVQGNLVVVHDPGSTDLSGWGAQHQGVLASLGNTDVEVSGNRFVGGRRAVYVANHGGRRAEANRITDNLFEGQIEAAFGVGQPGLMPVAQAEYVDHAEVTIEGNVVHAPDLDPATPAGWLAPGVQFRKNCIESGGYALQVYAPPAPGVGEPPVASGNTLIGQAGALTFRPGQVTGLVVTDNIVSSEVPAAVVDGAGNVTTGNTVDSDAHCPALPPVSVQAMPAGRKP